MKNDTITAIPGLLAGHASSPRGGTGCTALLFPEGFTPGLHVPGFATASRELEPLRPESTVDAVHGIVLSGGSAFGLAAADGAARFLRERGVGFAMPHGVIPIVSAAAIYDLDVNEAPGFLPDARLGYAAAQNASSAPLAGGKAGAGSGARCGRIFSQGPLGDLSAPAGLGSALVEYRGIQLAALVVLNALGNIHNPEDGSFVSGARAPGGQALGEAEIISALAAGEIPPANTVLTVLATNVPLDKTRCSRLARMASSGLARCIFPAHLALDGDITFALASKRPLDVKAGDNLLGCLGALAVTRAVLRAARPQAAPVFSG